ncbi:MAG: peptidyl-prolyl cis-trans isomerase [Candidatus Omnitrophica bacterium]|nr:peptidyl-prolyl cis-trans isomerase [Candidatus Omnitrophota bacterium]
MNTHWFRVFSCIVLALMIPSLAAAKPLHDAIIAIVNDDVITLKDLKDYMSGVYRQLKVENKDPKEIQETMASYEEKGVDQLVEDKLILAAADEKGLEIRPEAIEKQLKDIKDRYPSEDQFLEALNTQGMTVTDLKNKLIRQMKAKYMVDIEVKNKIFVNPQDVTRYYNDHSHEFEHKTKYNLDSIYISFDQDKDQAIKRIGEARQKLAAGEDFQKMAQEYSEAPSVGTLEEGQMVPAVEKEVFGLKIGDISQPVAVEGGVYVFKVTGILAGGVQSLQEARDSVYNKLYNQQFQEKFKAWIDKLHEKAYVEIRS